MPNDDNIKEENIANEGELNQNESSDTAPKSYQAVLPISGIKNNIVLTPESSSVQNTSSYKSDDAAIEIEISAQNLTEDPTLSSRVNIEYSGDNANAQLQITNNDGTYAGNINISGSSQIGNVQINGSGNYTIGEGGTPEHNLDAAMETAVSDDIILNAQAHNDREQTYIQMGIKRPLMRKENNPNSEEAEYQEQKEALLESDDSLNVTTKDGYSNQDKGFFSSNSLLFKIGEQDFLRAKFDISRYTNFAELMTDLKKFKISLSDKTERSKEEEGLTTKTQGLDFTFKGNKNIYTGNLRQQGTYLNGDNISKNYTVGAKAEFNRTEYGTFQDGLNGAAEGNLILSDGNVDGYKIALDGAYNDYGTGSTECLFNLGTSLEKQNNTTIFNVESYNAIRFNNCRTIIEPQASFTYQKDAEGNSTKKYYVGAGIFQQISRNLDNGLLYYTQAGYHTSHGYEKSGYAEVCTGLKKKATQRLTVNAENKWRSDTGWEGSVGVSISLP